MFALLAGNLTSILTSLAITVIGSLFRPENFNFSKLKHEIFVVDETIRKRLEKETNEESLKNASRFSKQYGLSLTLILVVVWPIPLFFSNYVFTATVYHVWIWVAILWAVAAASMIWILPIIQSRDGISHVLKNIVKSSIPRKTDKPEYRDFTSAGGKTIKALLVDKTEDTLTLELPNGKKATLSYEKLSKEDQELSLIHI